ncbi:MBL fold metallo-hydrolase [Sphingomonas sp. MMS24-JH45]
MSRNCRHIRPTTFISSSARPRSREGSHPRLGDVVRRAPDRNDWGDCDPAEPRNARTRASIMVEHEGVRGTGGHRPRHARAVARRRGGTVDAIIWTHEHADHVFGIDDVRQIFHARGSAVPGYARPSTDARLRAQFGYVFEGRRGYPPTVALQPLPDVLEIGGLHHSCRRPAAWVHHLGGFGAFRTGPERSATLPTSAE